MQRPAVNLSEQSANKILPRRLAAAYTQEIMPPEKQLTGLSISDCPPTWRVRWVLARFAVVILTAVSLLSAVVMTVYWQDRSHEESLVTQQSQDLVNLQYELIHQELSAVESDLLVLSEQQTLQRFLDDPESGRAELEQDYLRFARVKRIYDQIRILDANGTEVVRVNGEQGAPRAVAVEELQGKSARYYYRQALRLKRGEVLVTPFDLNIEKGTIEEPLKPVIRMITPLTLDNGTPRGMLVLNYLGTPLLSKLLESASGARGQVMLLNGDGEYLLAPQSGAAWGWMLGHHRSFASDFPEAWKRIQQQPDKPFVENEGLFSVRWLDPIPAEIAAKTAMREATTSSGIHRSALAIVAYVNDVELHANSRAALRRLWQVHSLATLFVTALAWYLVRASWQRRCQEHRIAESEQRLRRLSSQLLVAQEEERRNLSRELHDELGQQVTAIRLDIRSALAERDEARRETSIREAMRETDELLQSLHRIATRVRPFILDDLGLLDAIESHVVDFGRRTGIHVHTDLAIPVRRIASTLGDNVYRIVQEALNNVARHANTKEAYVTVHAEDDQLHVTVRDQGVGFDFSQRDLSRLGILGIQERAELLGGRFEVTTTPGHGTEIRVVLPLPIQQEAHVYR